MVDIKLDKNAIRKVIKQENPVTRWMSWASRARGSSRRFCRQRISSPFVIVAHYE
jgi:hypothetical protein